jgi:hypothetical protein
MFPGSMSPQKAGADRPTTLMPASLTIYLVRHAEKSHSGNFLRETEKFLNRFR